MSREIRFRCWDQKDKKYLLPEKQGFVILPTIPSFGVTLPYENCSNPGNIDEDCIDWADADLLMGRYELEQYTGLKDDNGKEIYEGDIIKQLMYVLKGKECFTTWVVRWYNDESCYDLHRVSGALYGDSMLSARESKNYEVIGNIHENPELLEAEK